MSTTSRIWVVVSVVGVLVLSLMLGAFPWVLVAVLAVALIKRRPSSPSKHPAASPAKPTRPREPLAIRLLKLPVGCIVIVALFAIFGGSGGLAFLGLSIICTAGAMLLVWLPLAHFIGSFIFMLFRRGRELRESGGGGRGTPAERRSGNQLAISQYIVEATRYGLTREEIAQRLRDQGWPDNEIQQAYGGGAVPV